MASSISAETSAENGTKENFRMVVKYLTTNEFGLIEDAYSFPNYQSVRPGEVHNVRFGNKPPTPVLIISTGYGSPEAIRKATEYIRRHKTDTDDWGSDVVLVTDSDSDCKSDDSLADLDR